MRTTAMSCKEAGAVIALQSIKLIVGYSLPHEPRNVWSL